MSNTIYVLDGSGDAVVPSGATVRITIFLMAGSEIGAASIRGPATFTGPNDIVRITDGPPSVGANEVEFEVSTTGCGNVTLEFPVKYPTADEPETRQMTFVVEQKN